jgi:hypothetical protein
MLLLFSPFSSLSLSLSLSLVLVALMITNNSVLIVEKVEESGVDWLV